MITIIINYKTNKFYRFLSGIFQDKMFRYPQIMYNRSVLKALQMCTTFCQHLSTLYHFPPTYANFCQLVTTVA